MDKIKITVTSASGVEAVTKRELFRLGFGNPPSINGAMTFEGTLYDIALLNMFLRTADRVYLNIKEFTAYSFDELFEEVKKIPWKDYFEKDACVLINGKSVKSKLFALSAMQSVIKKAICENLCSAYKVNSLSETGNKYKLEFFVYKDKVSLLLNTSGQGLHKRGYRSLVGKAPIKETLASAILQIAGVNAYRPFYDPFCGSGTLVLEGARMALNIASGINRTFDYQNFSFIDGSFYKTVLEKAKDEQDLSKKIEFCGSDIDENAISLCNYHAKQAGIKDKVKFKVLDVKYFTSDKENGIIVTNPPYGERLSEGKEAIKLYRAFGDAYRTLNKWSAFIITASNQFESSFRKKADKTRKLYNSNIECRLYEYFNKKPKGGNYER